MTVEMLRLHHKLEDSTSLLEQKLRALDSFRNGEQGIVGFFSSLEQSKEIMVFSEGKDNDFDYFFDSFYWSCRSKNARFRRFLNESFGEDYNFKGEKIGTYSVSKLGLLMLTLDYGIDKSKFDQEIYPVMPKNNFCLI